MTFAVILLVAASVITNKVLMVDQEGNVNEPAALASTADMAAVKAATITAAEKAHAAEVAAHHGTNLISDVVSDIGRNELVVYRYGYTDGISAAFVLDADAKLMPTGFMPLNEYNADGLRAFDISYALQNSTEFEGQPIIRWRGALDDGTDFEPIEQANIEPVTKLPAAYTNSEGVVYQHHYKAKFWDVADTKGFYLVTILGDDAAGDGAAIELPNGVKGGYTGPLLWGGHKLDVVGGVIVGVGGDE